MVTALLDPHMWVALATLSLLEIVLGIDNLVFIAVITDKLPPKTAKLARRIGLTAAALSRIALLLLLVWIKHLTTPLFTIGSFVVTGQSLVLVGGGLFLIAKSATEIHGMMEDGEEQLAAKPARAFSFVILQIMILDIVFSLDSVITAIGLVNEIPIMVTAIILAILVMIFLAEVITRILKQHPTIKMLALSFLLMIGLMLLIEGFGIEVPKGYIYTAMGFAVLVEILNNIMRHKHRPNR